MLWYREFGTTELIFTAAFLLLYVLYLVRIFRTGAFLGLSIQGILLKLLLRTCAFVLLVASVLGPSFGDSKKEVKSIGKDIMICVDLSKSMDAFDIQPTRLEKVKYEMKKLVSAFSSDRIGIIIFSSEAFMQCPLTFDQNALHLFIETMNTGLVPSSGTDFAPPLRMAMKKLNDDEGNTVAQAKSKIIILISDGEDFGETTQEITNDIETKGVKLFTLGVGTAEGGKIHAAGGYKKDNTGRDVVSKLNAKSLRTLASRTGGEYFEINAGRNDISRLINAINSIEGELRDVRFVDVTANKYFYFLGLAILLLAADLLIRVRTFAI